MVAREMMLREVSFRYNSKMKLHYETFSSAHVNALTELIFLLQGCLKVNFIICATQQRQHGIFMSLEVTHILKHE